MPSARRVSRHDANGGNADEGLSAASSGRSSGADRLRPRIALYPSLFVVPQRSGEPCPWSLLAYASVDPLAQQVGVAHVAGVLLDHSDQRLAQRHRAAAAAVLIQGIVGGDVETGRPGYEPRGEVRLRAPRVPRLRDHQGIGNSTIEIPVTVGL